MTDFSTLVNKAENIFNTEKGKAVYAKIQERIGAFGLMDKINSGVAVGFSGGADSVLLLIFLRKLKKAWNFMFHAFSLFYRISTTS